jgi:hypothetical protein
MAETIPTTPVTDLSDHELAKETLRWRGPWGELPEFWSGSEAAAISDRSVLLHQELRRRGLKLPRHQSIGRRSPGSTLTVEEYDAWKSALDEWEAGSPAPLGEDVYITLEA